VTLILCVDATGGLAFAGKRQSSDLVMLQKMQQLVGNAPLAVSPYTRQLLEARGIVIPNLTVAENPQQTVSANGFCFAELQPVSCTPDALVLFHWNRDYPETVRLHLVPEEWRLISRAPLPSETHPEMFWEVWRRKQQAPTPDSSDRAE